MRSPLALVLVVTAACNVTPVEWEETAAVERPDSAALVIEADGGPAFVDVPVVPAAWTPGGACEGSVRIARGPGDELHAVWWQPRGDGSAALLSRRSLDAGRTWEAVVPVDTMDRARLGCSRPAPAITVDAPTRFVHVAYFLRGPQGPGVFFSHSMERGTYYHAPVQIVYGERPSAVDVASDDSAVAVAFQDPNTTAPRVSVALSTTHGHLFEIQLPRISPSTVAAECPLVAVRGDRIAVAWLARPARGPGDGITMLRVGERRR